MELKDDVEIGLFLSLEEEFKGDDPCEHSQHDTNPEAHEGPGVWYLSMSGCATGCGHPTRTFLACDTFFKAIMKPNAHIRCPKCRNRRPALESYTSFVRKG